MTTATADAPAAPSGLRRVLGLPALTFFGVGMILGAGIDAQLAGLLAVVVVGGIATIASRVMPARREAAGRR